MTVDDTDTTTQHQAAASDVAEPAEEQPQEPQEDTPQPGQRSLEDLLAGLDETARKSVLRQVRKARTEASNLRSRLNEVQPKVAEYDQLIETRKTAEQKATERAEAAEQRAQTANERLVMAEVRAQAATDFADPDDAPAFLDMPALLDDDGEVDTEAVAEALTELLKNKPHLRKTDTPRRPAPDPSQGSSAGSSSTTPEEAFAAFLTAQLRS